MMKDVYETVADAVIRLQREAGMDEDALMALMVRVGGLVLADKPGVSPDGVVANTCALMVSALCVRVAELEAKVNQ